MHREGETFAYPPFMLDRQGAPMRVDRGSDVVSGQPLADEVGLTVDLNAAAVVDLADERHAPARQGQLQAAAAIAIGRQAEALGKGPQLAAVQLEPAPGQAGGIAIGAQGPMRLVEVVVAQEGSIGAPKGPQVGTGVLQHPLLPQVVEALHMGVAARFAFGDEH